MKPFSVGSKASRVQKEAFRRDEVTGSFSFSSLWNLQGSGALFLDEDHRKKCIMQRASEIQRIESTINSNLISV